MSIDAKVKAVHIDGENGSGYLELVDRKPGGCAGQKALYFTSSDPVIHDLTGRNVWGGSGELILGDVEIAKRTGYTTIEFTSPDVIRRAVDVMKKRFCSACMNGVRSGLSECPSCGRDARVAVINHTGKYLRPLVRDLLAFEWLKIMVDRRGLYYPEYTGGPPAPRLLQFPGPYHPLEVALTQRGGFARGWGGYREWLRLRENLPAFIAVVSGHLYWPRATAWVIFHLLTPRMVNGLVDDPTPGIRALLYADLGVGAAAAGKALADVNCDYTADRDLTFWGGLVKGEVEL